MILANDLCQPSVCPWYNMSCYLGWKHCLLGPADASHVRFIPDVDAEGPEHDGHAQSQRWLQLLVQGQSNNFYAQ